MRPSDTRLHIRSEGPVMRVELRQDDNENLLTGDTWGQLAEAFEVLPPEIRVVVLSGGGPSFSVGGDRTEVAELVEGDPSGESVRQLAERGRRALDAIGTCDAVTIARVHGRVMGGGFCLMLGCDLRVATDDALFAMPEMRLGLPPVWGGTLARMISEIGMARTRELVLTSDVIDAVTAQRYGVVNKVVPAADVDAAVEQWAQPLARRRPTTVRTAKTVLRAYERAARLADATLLDSHLMAAAIANS